MVEGRCQRWGMTWDRYMRVCVCVSQTGEAPPDLKKRVRWMGMPVCPTVQMCSPPQTHFRSVPDRLASSSLSAALNPRAVPSVSRNFTVNASYCLGVTCTSSGASAASNPLRFSFGDTPNASLRSVCCGPPAASDARRFPEPEGDGLGGIAAARWHSDDAGR